MQRFVLIAAGTGSYDQELFKKGERERTVLLVGATFWLIWATAFATASAGKSRSSTKSSSVLHRTSLKENQRVDNKTPLRGIHDLVSVYKYHVRGPLNMMMKQDSPLYVDLKRSQCEVERVLEVC